MKKVKRLEPIVGQEMHYVFVDMVETFNQMVDSYNELIEIMGEPKMRTKQETIDFCENAIQNLRLNAPGTPEIAAYQSVIDFLEEKDEATETTLVG